MIVPRVCRSSRARSASSSMAAGGASPSSPSRAAMRAATRRRAWRKANSRRVIDTQREIVSNSSANAMKNAMAISICTLRRIAVYE
ncbi:MAG: hypothetical protein BWZ10_01634 [candidate division BRC1 bacterium ADurb.BinA364]|nr:MAG: hypothetical protein BWZ10_01634 [candidate division BRC1 bacterium ADurb.BinA364]